MKNEVEIKMLALLEEIAQSHMFVKYYELQRMLLAKPEILNIIEDYRTKKAIYMDAVIGHETAEQKQLLNEELLKTKKRFEQHDELKEYYRLSRNVEFFLNDLNYEIMQLLHVEKTSCK